MKMISTILALTAMGACSLLVCCAQSDGLAPTNSDWISNSTNAALYWQGVWQEDTNGWRVELTFDTNDTELQVRVGSVVITSGGGYLMTPSGKFAKFELVDPDGNLVPPKPGAGTILRHMYTNATFGTNLPAWADPSDGALEENFPDTISSDVYPRDPTGEVAGDFYIIKGLPPNPINFLKLRDAYSITNEGDYTLTVCPILYKMHSRTNLDVLDRIDLPCVTTKIHLVPNH